LYRAPANFSAKKAHAVQRCLSKKAVLEDKLSNAIKACGGIDVSYVGDVGVGVATVLDYNNLKLLESQVGCCQVKMPYIPTLLSFRELPPAVAAIKKLHFKPNLFLLTHNVGLTPTDAVSQPTSE
jgi:deoxyribonuclease V